MLVDADGPLEIFDPPQFLETIATAVTAAGCWLWEGGIRGRVRYSTVLVDGRTLPAWAYVFELLRGEIGIDQLVFRVCPVTSCVNPNHYELEYDGRRVGSVEGRHEGQTRCYRGHPLGGANLVLLRGKAGQFYRGCRACGRAERLRVQARTNKAERKCRPPDTVLRALLAEVSKRQIGFRYGVSPATVNRWANDLGSGHWRGQPGLRPLDSRGWPWADLDETQNSSVQSDDVRSTE